MNYQLVDLEALTLDPIVKTTATGTILRVKNGAHKLTFQTPKLSLAWDCTVRDNTFGKQQCVLPLCMTDPTFKTWLHALESRIRTLLRHGTDIRQVFFRRPLLVMEPQSPNLSALFLPRVRFDTDTSHIVTPVVDPSQSSLEATVLKHRVDVVALVSLEFIHIATNNNVSVRMETEKIRAYKKELDFDDVDF